MPEIGYPIDFEKLGIQPADVTAVDILHHKPGHLVCRLKVGGSWRVLKWFNTGEALEPQVYAMLSRYGIPTLPVHACTGQALLLEDLEHSREWRLANQSDMRHARTGIALAAWYRSLHAAGYMALSRGIDIPVKLHPWVEAMTEDDLVEAGIRLAIDNLPGWQAAVGKLELLKARVRHMRQTFNYEDFGCENLALSRGRAAPLRAVVFDYDCFTLGMAYSDIRNVLYSLEGDARQAFCEAYGGFNETERLLDIPLATFYGLMVAAQREWVPGWARPLLEDVKSGRVGCAIADALG